MRGSMRRKKEKVNCQSLQISDLQWMSHSLLTIPIKDYKRTSSAWQ